MPGTQRAEDPTIVEPPAPRQTTYLTTTVRFVVVVAPFAVTTTGTVYVPVGAGCEALEQPLNPAIAPNESMANTTSAPNLRRRNAANPSSGSIANAATISASFPGVFSRETVAVPTSSVPVCATLFPVNVKLAGLK